MNLEYKFAAKKKATIQCEAHTIWMWKFIFIHCKQYYLSNVLTKYIKIRGSNERFLIIWIVSNY